MTESEAKSISHSYKLLTQVFKILFNKVCERDDCVSTQNPYLGFIWYEQDHFNLHAHNSQTFWDLGDSIVS